MQKLLFGLLLLVPGITLATPGAYVSLNAGVNQIDSNNRLQKTTTGFAGGFAAGYLWSCNNSIEYGIEGDALLYPNSNSSKDVSGVLPPPIGDLQIQYDGYNLSLLGVLKYVSHSGFVGFIKGGAAYVDQQVTSHLYYGTFTQPAKNMFAPEASIGVGYALNRNFEVDLTWDHVFADHQNTEDAIAGNIKVVSNNNYLLGLTYHFA
jgi:opacity protein-like surface antigen